MLLYLRHLFALLITSLLPCASHNVNYLHPNTHTRTNERAATTWTNPVRPYLQSQLSTHQFHSTAKSFLSNHPKWTPFPPAPIPLPPFKSIEIPQFCSHLKAQGFSPLVDTRYRGSKTRFWLNAKTCRWATGMVRRTAGTGTSPRTVAND